MYLLVVENKDISKLPRTTEQLCTVNTLFLKLLPFLSVMILNVDLSCLCSLRQTATITVRWRVMSTQTSASVSVLGSSTYVVLVYLFSLVQ